MASKRALTGGTGDVNPQYLSGRVDQTSVNQTITKQFPLPVPRIPQSKKATVVELLKVYVAFPFLENIDALFTRRIVFTTVSFGTDIPGLDEPNVFSFFVDANVVSNVAGLQVWWFILKLHSKCVTKLFKPLSKTILMELDMGFY